jgi:hypothetical protein
MTRLLRFLCWPLPRGARLRPTPARHVVILVVSGASWPVLLQRGGTLLMTRRQLRREAKIVAKMEGGEP